MHPDVDERPDAATLVTGPAHRCEGTGIPDLAVPIDDVFEIGDAVIARWHVTGTNTGEALGQPPGGRSLDITGQHILRFADGRVAEEWVAYDALGLIQQLGLQLP